MKNLALCLLAVLLLAAFAVLVEAMSICDHYENLPAVIVNVQDDPPFGYVGESRRTLVKWSDGYRGYVPGDLGEPGDEILANRRTGTRSLFGLMGDHRL